MCGVNLIDLKLQLGDKMLINFKDIFWHLEKSWNIITEHIALQQVWLRLGLSWVRLALYDKYQLGLSGFILVGIQDVALSRVRESR